MSRRKDAEKRSEARKKLGDGVPQQEPPRAKLVGRYQELQWSCAEARERQICVVNLVFHSPICATLRDLRLVAHPKEP